MGVKLLSASAGSVELVAPATASNYTATMPAGTGTVVVNGVSGSIVSGTAVASTSGTSIDFTGIPSWVKRITVMFNGVSTSGASNWLIQLGDDGGVETTGYVSSATTPDGTTTTTSSTSGFVLTEQTTGASTHQGFLSLVNLTGNSWIGSANIASSEPRMHLSAGTKTLSDTLTQVRITTVNGTDTFDAGSINILYE